MKLNLFQQLVLYCLAVVIGNIDDKYLRLAGYIQMCVANKEINGNIAEGIEEYRRSIDG